MNDEPAQTAQQSLAEISQRLENLVQQLARTATQLEAVLDTIENGIVMADTDLVIRFFNRRMAEWLGVSSDQVIGRGLAHVAAMLEPQVQEPGEFLRSLEQVAAQRDHVIRDEIVVTSPVHRMLRRHATPIYNPNGTLLGRLAVFTDVTEQRRLEHLRDEFLSVAAHEFKTPVTVIKGYAELLLQHPPASSDPRERKALETINRQTDRINRLVQDLLEISRVQMGQLTLRTERFDLSRLTADLVKRLAGSTPRHSFAVDARSPAFVDADRVRVQQVIADLLDNAVKYSPRGGQIDVAVEAVDGTARVSVRDRGIGIPQDRQPRIFERFYRAHAGTPHDYGGMGVGLYISREIIARHGGRLWFTSKEDEGSTFYFNLPLAADEAKHSDGR